MRIRALKIKNYRTLEDIEIAFPSYYTAISGKNDSGKSNLIRMIRALMKEEIRFPFFGDEDELSLENDYPQWKEMEAKDREIAVSIDVVVGRDYDFGIYNFLNTYLSLEEEREELFFTLNLTLSSNTPEQRIQVMVNGQSFDGVQAQDVLKKLQSSKTFIFHNSTDPGPHYRGTALFKDLSDEYQDRVESAKRAVNRELQKIAKEQQKELAQLLGRLQAQYKVGLSLPTYDFSYMPLDITLGDKKVNVPLEEWGSGTKNRTLIFLNLLRARQISLSDASASKITPVLTIEEPESFLHPSAQAEFGRVLQDLATEFKVQVLVTSHSPYMLSLDDPKSNVLLQRKLLRSQLRETQIVDTEGDDWMEPFAAVLGLDNEMFKPWKQAMFGSGESVLLVEGDIDKEYFELLRDPAHGANRLKFEGQIIPYDGCANLKNSVLLKFVNERYKKVFITFDLDVKEEIERSLSSLSLQEGKDYKPVGFNQSGKKDIEGLVPDDIKSPIFAANVDLVQQVMSGSQRERRSAKNNLKRLILESFKRESTPGTDYFKHFYSIAKVVDKALC